MAFVNARLTFFFRGALAGVPDTAAAAAGAPGFLFSFAMFVLL